MQPLESQQLAARMKQLIPTMNEEQRDSLASAFLPFEVEIVFEAISAHAQTNKFLNISTLMDQIGLQSRKHSASAQARFEGEKQRVSSRLSTLAEQRKKVNEDRIRAAEIVDALTAEDRDRIEAQIKREFPFVTGFGLIRHIADRAQQQGLHLQKRN